MTREEIDTFWQQALQKSAKQNGRAVHDEFAALVAAHEREECAKICLEEAPSLDGQLCAEAIRARGEKP